MATLHKAIEGVLMKSLKKDRSTDVPPEVRMAITQWVVLSLPHAREIEKLCSNFGSTAGTKKLAERVSTANYMFQTQVRCVVLSVGRVVWCVPASLLGEPPRRAPITSRCEILPLHHFVLPILPLHQFVLRSLPIVKPCRSACVLLPPPSPTPTHRAHARQLKHKHKYMCDLPRGLPRSASGTASGSSTRGSKVGSDDHAYLWYCPLTEELSVYPPELTPIEKWHRGGFLCEEMGMGKTLITLALILANPAPPLTSRQAKLLMDPTLKRFLKGELTQKEIEADKWTLGAEKVPSRSTLVVCAVSLVDQVSLVIVWYR